MTTPPYNARRSPLHGGDDPRYTFLTWIITDHRLDVLLGHVQQDTCPSAAWFTPAEYPTRWRARVAHPDDPIGADLGGFDTAHAAAMALVEAPRQLIIIELPEPLDDDETLIPVLGYVTASRHYAARCEVLGDRKPARLWGPRDPGTGERPALGSVYPDGLVVSRPDVRGEQVVLVLPGGTPTKGVS